MIVHVRITPRPGVLDPEGRAVERALRDLGYDLVSDVRTGKWISLDLATDDRERALALARELCEKLLANPVIEQYEVQAED